RISAVRSANVSFLLFYSSPVPPRHPPPFPTRRSSDLVPCADRQPPSPRELRGPLLRGPHLLLVLRLLRLHRRLRIQRNEHGEQHNHHRDHRTHQEGQVQAGSQATDLITRVAIHSALGTESHDRDEDR